MGFVRLNAARRETRRRPMLLPDCIPAETVGRFCVPQGRRPMLVTRTRTRAVEDMSGRHDIPIWNVVCGRDVARASLGQRWYKPPREEDAALRHHRCVHRPAAGG